MGKESGSLECSLSFTLSPSLLIYLRFIWKLLLAGEARSQIRETALGRETEEKGKRLKVPMERRSEDRKDKRPGSGGTHL